MVNVLLALQLETCFLSGEHVIRQVPRADQELAVGIAALLVHVYSLIRVISGISLGQFLVALGKLE